MINDDDKTFQEYKNLLNTARKRIILNIFFKMIKKIIEIVINTNTRILFEDL